MKESVIQKAIMQYLQILENQGKLYFFRAGSGAIPTGNGGYFKTGKVGCPDIVVCLRGLFVGLEIKNEKGRQSPSQKIAQEAIETAGGRYYIVRSVDDVERILEEI